MEEIALSSQCLMAAQTTIQFERFGMQSLRVYRLTLLPLTAREAGAKINHVVGARRAPTGPWLLFSTFQPIPFFDIAQVRLVLTSKGQFT